MFHDLSLNVLTASRVCEDASIKVGDEIETAAHKAISNVYDQILKAFDGFPPSIPDTDIRTVTIEVEQLVKVAQDLGFVYLISSHIGNALLQHRQALYKAIFADPPQYPLLSIALENHSIYAESLVHMIGAYPC